MPDHVDLLDLPADLVGHSFRPLLLFQFDFYFNEYVHSLHI